MIKPEFLNSKQVSVFQGVPKKLFLQNTVANRLTVCKTKRKYCGHPVKPSLTRCHMGPWNFYLKQSVAFRNLPIFIKIFPAMESFQK